MNWTVKITRNFIPYLKSLLAYNFKGRKSVDNYYKKYILNVFQQFSYYEFF